VKLHFSEVACRTVTILAAQKGENLLPWKSYQGEGYDIAMLAIGQESAASLVASAQDSNTIWTWVKRVVGWILCFIGFQMITSIITTTADITLNWIPLLGGLATSLINLGVFIANVIMATSTSVIVAAVAWVFYRPVLGVTLLVGAIGLTVMGAKAGDAAGKPKQKA